MRFSLTNLSGMFKRKRYNLTLRETEVPKPLLAACFAGSAWFPCLCHSQLMSSEPLPPFIKPLWPYELSPIFLPSSSAILNLWGVVHLKQGARAPMRPLVTLQTSASVCEASSSIYSGLWVHVVEAVMEQKKCCSPLTTPGTTFGNAQVFSTLLSKGRWQPSKGLKSKASCISYGPAQLSGTKVLISHYLIERSQ